MIVSDTRFYFFHYIGPGLSPVGGDDRPSQNENEKRKTFF